LTNVSRKFRTSHACDSFNLISGEINVVTQAKSPPHAPCGGLFPFIWRPMPLSVI
jgi:hypothetical protein